MNGLINNWAMSALAAITLLAASCDEVINPTPVPGGQKPSKDIFENLSLNGTANCYITINGNYSFDATVAGNGVDAPAIKIESVTLLWQSQKSLIDTVYISEEKDKVLLATSTGYGNALIAGLDKQKNIVWSWHIWQPAEEVGSVKTKTGYEMCTLNLGASSSKEGSIDSYGMLYQWGRKDPFPGSPTLTGDTSTLPAKLYDYTNKEIDVISHSSWSDTECNTLAYSIANPTVVLSNYSQYATTRDWLIPSEANDALWGNPQGGVKDSENKYSNKGSKSCYDPCPVGWRVPPADALSTATSSGGYDENTANFDVNGEFNCGWNIKMEEGTMFFPAAARYDGSYAMLYGSVAGLWGNYWSNSPYSGGTMANGLGFAMLSFQNTAKGASMSPAAGGGKADAYSVRCIKE